MEQEGGKRKYAPTSQGVFRGHTQRVAPLDSKRDAAHNTTTHLYNGYIQQEMVDDIANLATATASDRAAIAQLTSTVERLTAELVTVNAKLVTALQT